jgi:hypothetical protein
MVDGSYVIYLLDNRYRYQKNYPQILYYIYIRTIDNKFYYIPVSNK